MTPFFSDRPCNGFQEVLARYSSITPTIKLAAPTTFAPLIKETIQIVKRTKEYHILLIIADGEVSTSEIEPTAAAIVEASHYPISIIMVGVGDGPWEAMEEFDDGLPERRFDNFQCVSISAPLLNETLMKLRRFVNFHECLIKYDGLDVAFVRPSPILSVFSVASSALELSCCLGCYGSARNSGAVCGDTPTGLATMRAAQSPD